MKKLLLFIVLVVGQTISAQVGIGTTSPSAELEVEGTNTGIPALELNPQSAPAGSATGQLAVIGDQLFMYDATRAKWLSVAATALTFGSAGNIDNQMLLSGGDVNDTDSGIYMPYNGTIVFVSARSSGGLATKGFDVRVRNGTTTNSTTSFNLAANNFSNSTYNVNFNAGDYINVFCQAAGGNVTDPVVTVWVKWRR